MPDFDQIVQRLGDQMARGEVILFTGAGFSYGATDRDGRAIPQVRQLKEEIWDLIWPGEPGVEESSLADTYAAALSEAGNDLAALMRNRLTVLPESVTDAHQRWLSMPWRRAYTLNIDDLEAAASRAYDLPRRIQPVSGLGRSLPLGTGSDLLYVHLNGMLDDIPKVTFTDPQYGRRQAQGSALYDQLAADLLAYPVVFVGTELRESLFWQYVALRDERGSRGVSEHRRRSYLVTPTLPPDRQRLLRAYNIAWVPATAGEFAESVLERLEEPARKGHAIRAAAASPHEGVTLRPVAELAALPSPRDSEYLLGVQPTWRDIADGRAVQRDFERELAVEEAEGCLLVKGTAGAGTSTTLMRLALRAVAADRDVRWIDANHVFDARELSRALKKHGDEFVLVVDDADTFGPPVAELAEDVATTMSGSLLILGMRSARADRVMRGWQADGTLRREVTVPLLGDSDIGRLLETLERHNQLGALKKLDQGARVDRIKREFGRELLVAMFEATSGERFETRAYEEFLDLVDEQQVIYAIVALASELRFALGRDEILMATGDISNTALYALERLLANRLLIQSADGYVVRHRRIAELVVRGMRGDAIALAPYQGLVRAIAARHQPGKARSREAKLVTALISHARVLRFFALDDARRLYAGVEDLLANDYHFWLQRGSMEVESGNLSRAANYLQQAFAGGEHDHRLQTEWAYYLIKSAHQNPRADDAAEKVAQGQEILLNQIERRGEDDAYPWHVYGSQMLGWLRRAPLPAQERERQLEIVKTRVKDGSRLHPHAEELRGLARDLEEEWLMTVVPDPRS
jgi:hypothetical protein